MDEEQDVIEQPETETPVIEAAPVEDDGPLIVQFGDDAPDGDIDEEEVAKAPQWVQDLRKRDRENAKAKRDLEKRIKELEAATTPAKDAPKLGPKPTLESCDYDEGAFETALETWYQDKTKVETAQREAEEQTRSAQQAWEAKVSSYNEAKAKLPFNDFDEAEAFIQDTFDATQQALLIKVAKDAPTLVYALGKNPKKANELAGIKDYTEFVAEAVRLEMSVKTTRKPVTSPERAVSVPSGTGVASTDNTLERLRAEAEKTGDYSKVMQYRRAKRA
jgi:hypothetical protein